jgi:hypothetical protein
MKTTKTLLEEELARLQQLSRLASQLKVVWTPNRNHHLSGEVKGITIFIYESDKTKAIRTLRHEFIDYCVSQPNELYKDLVNTLIKSLSEQAYRHKEQIVEGLLRLVD